MRSFCAVALLFLSFLAFGSTGPVGHPAFDVHSALARHWGGTTIELPRPIEKRSTHPTTVAIIDTGIDYSQIALKENLYLPQGEINDKNFGIDFSVEKSTPGTTPVDTIGHGTHVAGIIKGIYPNVRLLIIKYYNTKASGIDNLKSTIEAFKFAIASHVDIINFSGGGPGYSSEELEVLRQAEKQDILVVVAAGNHNKNIDDEKDHFYPASYGLNNFITVNAVNENFGLLVTSNWGKQTVNLSAPGENIPSFSLSGQITTMSGTSQATAYVTGIAALIKSQYPQLTAANLKQIILNSTVKVEKLKEICHSGGIVNAKNAVNYAEYFVTSSSTATSQNGVSLPTAL